MHAFQRCCRCFPPGYAEVLGFALPQFVSGRARRALERLAANRLLSQQLRLRNAHLLQPLAGLLVALWEAEQQQEAGQHGEGEAGGSGSGPGSSKAALEAGAGSGSSGDGGAASWEAAAPPGGGQEQGAAQGRQPRRRNSLLRALGRQAALTDDVLRGLRGVEVRPCRLRPCRRPHAPSPACGAATPSTLLLASS